ncbi:ATPase [Desulfonema ishimotonii]|uniref:ATPase n=1 Tax=Desulfonema ishimotonii TaxID=45657 RepID=A0A401FRX4_9BACT|nr:AAA family ATPase [Desulfonema ishimotonii]GBC59722.1 ATPase [Desulfonema ishimotonii]
MSESLAISQMGLKNFKNIRLENDILELKKLNVLIGPNGSGKSNLMKLIKFLRDALTTKTEDIKGITEFESSVGILGEQILDAVIEPPGTIALTFRFEPSEDLPKGVSLKIDLLIKSLRTMPVVKYETLSDAQISQNHVNPFYYYKAHDREPNTCAVSIFNDNIRTSSHFEYLKNVPSNNLTLGMIPELLERSDFSPELTPVYKVRRQLIDTLSGWRYYNANAMNLENIRESEPKIGPADIFLSPSGENLPVVLDNLVQKHFDFDDKINDALRSVFPKTRKIRTVRSGRLRLTIEWHMEDTKECFYLNDMSDGTVRMLCWAVILLSPDLPSLLLIDEPEIGLHPAWMRTLAEWIKMASDRTQVIVTTHSPDLLDHFSDKNQDIICFEYDGKNHFTPKRLDIEKLTPMFEDEWQLGDLYRVGDPSVGGWPW